MSAWGGAVAPLSTIEIVARTLGIFVARAGRDGLVLDDPGDQWEEFAALIGLGETQASRRDSSMNLGICDGCAGLKRLRDDGTIPIHMIGIPVSARAVRTGRRRQGEAALPGQPQAAEAGRKPLNRQFVRNSARKPNLVGSEGNGPLAHGCPVCSHQKSEVDHD